MTFLFFKIGWVLMEMAEVGKKTDSENSVSYTLIAVNMQYCVNKSLGRQYWNKEKSFLRDGECLH